MENIVKIHYSGKDYVGQIVSIESEWDCLRMIGKPETERTLLYYKVSMYEKDTGCLIDNIFIRSIEEIKQYEEKDRADNANRCAACGEVIPERIQICPACGRK